MVSQLYEMATNRPGANFLFADKSELTTDASPISDVAEHTNSATSHIVRGASTKLLASANSPQTKTNDIGDRSFERTNPGHLESTAPP